MKGWKQHIVKCWNRWVSSANKLQNKLLLFHHSFNYWSFLECSALCWVVFLTSISFFTFKGWGWKRWIEKDEIQKWNFMISPPSKSHIKGWVYIVSLWCKVTTWKMKSLVNQLFYLCNTKFRWKAYLFSITLVCKKYSLHVCMYNQATVALPIPAELKEKFKLNCFRSASQVI